jgi:hypothetical protein
VFHKTHYCEIADRDHSWNGTHREIHAGRMDGFTLANALSPADPTGSRAMGYYDQSDLPFYHALYSRLPWATTTSHQRLHRPFPAACMNGAPTMRPVRRLVQNVGSRRDGYQAPFEDMARTESRSIARASTGHMFYSRELRALEAPDWQRTTLSARSCSECGEVRLRTAQRT